jgi:hypothetical protein
MDCSDTHRHADSCPERSQLIDLLDIDLARLTARDGRPFTRGLAQVERDHLAGMGRPVARADRHRWRVRVHQHGPDGVRRVLLRGGQRAAELIDEPMPVGAGR